MLNIYVMTTYSKILNNHEYELFVLIEIFYRLLYSNVSISIRCASVNQSCLL